MVWKYGLSVEFALFGGYWPLYIQTLLACIRTWHCANLKSVSSSLYERDNYPLRYLHITSSLLSQPYDIDHSSQGTIKLATLCRPQLNCIIACENAPRLLVRYRRHHMLACQMSTNCQYFASSCSDCMHFKKCGKFHTMMQKVIYNLRSDKHGEISLGHLILTFEQMLLARPYLLFILFYFYFAFSYQFSKEEIKDKMSLNGGRNRKNGENYLRLVEKLDENDIFYNQMCN